MLLPQEPTNRKYQFFFLHEYKPGRRAASTDPDGQLLASMLVSQKMNDNNLPIYGCVVEGKFWYFIVLEQNTYSISEAYKSMTKDIEDIFRI